MKLTEKQKRFADYYIETGNATESAVRAGYSENTAKEMGYENLTKPHIKEYINVLISEKDNQRIAKQDEVLTYLTKVLRGEETERLPIVGKDFFELVDNTPSIRDRTKAAELLGKRYSLFTENHNVNANLGITIVDDIDAD